MSAYCIFSYNIDDTEEYEHYLDGVIPLLQKHRAEVLVADYEGQHLEGESRKANIVLRFENEEAARKWYEDPDYDAVKKIRFNCTSMGSGVLAKAFVPPSA